MVHDTSIDPIECAVFVVVAFIPAGVLQALWFKSRWSARFALPIDNGATVLGKRLFGDHKTLRGFVVFVPTAGVMFVSLSQIAQADVFRLSMKIWRLSPEGYALLGAFAGLGFMSGELPNSFVKRQLGIPPGGVPEGRLMRAAVRTVDRLDSTVGMLVAISLMVSTPWQLWLTVCVVGPVVHGAFSLLLSRFRLKGVAR